MDITILFKACVKTIRTTKKTFDGIEPKPSLVLRKPNRDEHLKKAKDIIKQITNLKNFFMDNKVAYLNVVNYLSTNKTMTEENRIAIDAEAQKIINTCACLIKDYRREINSFKCSRQVKEHYLNVIYLTETYLKLVSKDYTETKATRVKKVIDMHKISRLETSPKKSRTKELPEAKKTPKISPDVKLIDEELSPDEVQVFEEENKILYNELNSLHDEINQVESKVVGIAELQQLFTEKVLTQQKDIERIVNSAAITTDTLKDANEQIRQSIQINAGLRVWVLFFLLVMSFSLLFLDWYND